MEPKSVRHVKVRDDLWSRLVREAARRTLLEGRTVYPVWVLEELLEQLPDEAPDMMPRRSRSKGKRP